MYFDGDHSQSLGRTLWVITPDGSKNRLASAFILYKFGGRGEKTEQTPDSFPDGKFLRGNDGQVVEQEILIPQSGARFTTALFSVCLIFGSEQ